MEALAVFLLVGAMLVVLIVVALAYNRICGAMDALEAKQAKDAEELAGKVKSTASGV